MITRATHYGGYQSYGDKPITTLKPGQQSLERQYYDLVGKEQNEGYLSNYNRWNSVYSSRIGATVTPEDYAAKSRRPLDMAGKSIINEDSKLHTSHWTTMYKEEFIQKDDSGRTRRPDWSFHQKPHQVKMPPEFYRSKYA